MDAFSFFQTSTKNEIHIAKGNVKQNKNFKKSCGIKVLLFFIFFKYFEKIRHTDISAKVASRKSHDVLCRGTT